MRCDTLKNLPSTFPLSRVQPLALAVALAFAGDACLAEAAMAISPVTPIGSQAGARLAMPKALSSPRPDGSIMWIVENCNDAGEGSLRDAAFHANHGDGIDLGGLTCGTISVTTGAITLHDVDLSGPGAEHLEITGFGNQGKRIFNHSGGGGTLSISGVTIRGGTYVSNASLGGGCLRSTGGNHLVITDSVFRGCAVVTPLGQAGSALGGAIAFYGAGGIVHLYGTTIEGSLARTDHGSAGGGGLYAQGDVVMHASTIANNSVSASGSVSDFSGAISGGGLRTNGSVLIENSTLDGNTSSGDAGAALVGRGGTLLNSTVSHNIASAGVSGIVMSGYSSHTHIYSSTISGNVSERSQQGWSGGLYLYNKDVTITNSTITGNSETNQVGTNGTKFGAGIVFGPYAQNVTMSGTIVSGNYFDAGETSHAADDISCPTTLTILGDTNLVGWSHCQPPADTNWISDPKLGPLQDNGGPTWTHMPLPDSAAVDHGAAHGFDTDQRGHARVVGAAADIGSVESGNDRIFANGFDFDPN